MKAFSACQTRVRHEGTWLKEDEQLWRERRDDPAANTTSSKKIILVGRTKNNLTFSHFSVLVTWLGRLKHWAPESSLSAETRDAAGFDASTADGWCAVTESKPNLDKMHLKTFVKRMGNLRFHILVISLCLDGFSLIGKLSGPLTRCI